jgi:hypothetical protein
MGLGPVLPRRRGLKATRVTAPTSSSTPTATTSIPSDRIPDLVRSHPRRRTADIVIADRQTHTIEHFSPLKKRLQRVGSRVVNMAAGTELPDAASGFRAYSREALIRLNTIASFSYCMETIIQAGNKRLAITSIPVQTNPKTRESRLFHSTREHVLKSALIIIRAYIMYKPMMLFTTLGTVLFVGGLVPFVRFLILLEFGRNSGGVHHIQSLIAGSVLMIAAMLVFALGVIADLIRINRILVEDSLEQQKRQRFAKSEEALLIPDLPASPQGLPTRVGRAVGLRP